MKTLKKLFSRLKPEIPSLVVLAVIIFIASRALFHPGFFRTIDNVTTVLLFSPIVFLICQEAEIDPKVFAFPMIFASNIGGTLTLIGDPPNILIGNASRTGFMDFLKIMAVPTILSLTISIFIFLAQYKEIKNISPEKLAKLSQLDPKKAITDYKPVSYTHLTLPTTSNV